MQTLNPQHFSVKVKTLDDAIQLAHGKRHVGGCFKAIDGGYLVMWNSINLKG